MLDTRLQVETPEGVELSLPVAGPVIRTMAWIVDFSIRTGLALLGMFLLVLGSTGLGLYSIFMFAVSWFYPVFFEVRYRGATPGKMTFGLRVLHDNGTPVGWQAAMIRSVVGFVDVIPAIGLISSLCHPSFKRLGDMAAGTVVVHTERGNLGSIEFKETGIAPPVTLLPEEQRAVVEFAERAPMLTLQRRDELAGIAEPLTAGSEEPHRKLLAQAAWIAGHR
jgi:uncharacterized RDD family membrane protein YckC